MKNIWDLITENTKIFKAFEKIKTPEQKLADSDDKDMEKVGFSEWETLQVSSSFYYNNIYFSSAEKEKIVKEYREMANFPEVADALDDICDEAISVDDEGEIASLQINKEKILNNENISQNLQNEYDHVMEKVLDFNNTAFALFRKFYVEAELFGELVINPAQPKDGIKKVVLLQPETMFVDYDEYETIKGFKQKMENTDPRIREKINNERGIIPFKNNEIAYANSGIVSKTANKERLVVGFLDRARVSYRQLKWMEDALLIYRIIRAPERRVFTIDVGNLPKNKAEEYMKNIIQRYKQRKVYNPTTGEIDVGKNVLSMTEDFWLPKRSDGSGPSVQNLEGGANLGEIGDIIYFVKKLYKALKVPVKRVDDDNIYDYKGETTTREEIKFAKYVSRIREKFIAWVLHIYTTHLMLKGLWQQYHLEPEDISIVFNVENEWRETKKLNNLQSRVNMFNELSSMENKVFSKQYLKKNILKMTDEEIEENDKQLEVEAEEAARKREEALAQYRKEHGGKSPDEVEAEGGGDEGGPGGKEKDPLEQGLSDDAKAKHNFKPLKKMNKANPFKLPTLKSNISQYPGMKK